MSMEYQETWGSRKRKIGRGLSLTTTTLYAVLRDFKQIKLVKIKCASVVNCENNKLRLLHDVESKNIEQINLKQKNYSTSE